MTDIQGVNATLAAAERYVQDLQRRAYDAMVEITALLQAHAQLNHRFQNQTGNLEGSIKGAPDEDSAAAAGLIIGGYLAATMDYARFVEQAHEGKYAYLLPAIEHYRDDIRDILKRHLEA